MPVPGAPVGGERASGSTIAEPQMSASVEDTDEDFRDPEATLLDPIVLPKRRWGHYAKCHHDSGTHQGQKGGGCQNWSQNQSCRENGS